MEVSQNITLDFLEVRLFIFDFDGVLTNNIVHLDHLGNELVSCSRSDGLAFDLLRKKNKDVRIISTETNPVVNARARKLKVPVLQGVSNKYDLLKEIVNNENLEFEQICYVGNDINDYHAMKLCGLKVCPADSHKKIIEISDVVLSSKGGQGVVRELVEGVFQVDILEVLYIKENK
jgi:3-deoxy-D-manno-octulosonate 8-phosphate phosphatase (KDO 8-P phosphatase)